jgi:adenosine kinase
MSILISGSIAFDTIIQNVGSFRAQDDQENADMHLSLFSPTIRRDNGGTAANIAYSLALLGKHPHIIASIGEDGKDSLVRLQEMGIHTELVQVVPWSYCPQAYILRDEWNGQINTFHAGAMSLSGEITHRAVPFDFAIAAPDSKGGIIRRITECIQDWIYAIFDPGQAMGLFSKEELINMSTLAQITIMNEPEQNQFREITGENFIDICLASGHIAILTLWEKGSCIYSGTDEIQIAGIHTDHIVDATGCGDSYRSGLLYGLSEGWNITKSCQLGSIIGGIKIQSMWPQNHSLNKENINAIGKKEFNEKFFD